MLTSARRTGTGEDEGHIEMWQTQRSTHPHFSPAAMELQKNAHQKFKGKKRNGSKTRAAIMESITSLLKRSLNRAWVYHYSRANLFITNQIRIFSLNEFFLGFYDKRRGSNISSNASIFQTVKLSYHTRIKLSNKYQMTECGMRIRPSE